MRKSGIVLLNFLIAVLLAGAGNGAAQELSTSVMRPTPLDAAAPVLAGQFPGGGAPRAYYVAVELKAGNLLGQLRISGRPNGERTLTLERLGADAAVADQAFVRAGFGTEDEATKVFAIDASGRHVFRLTASGEETGSYCVLFGGTALPAAQPANCPRAAVPAAAPPGPKAVEVIASGCKERLRVSADVLFDFDRAELRREAGPALDQFAQRIAATDKKTTVEGHTDGKGADGYNQILSERRAGAVRDALVERGLRPTQFVVRGFGKSRPVASNQHADGTDDPDGRQKNRRVEVVVDACK